MKKNLLFFVFEEHLLNCLRNFKAFMNNDWIVSKSLFYRLTKFSILCLVTLNFLCISFMKTSNFCFYNYCCYTKFVLSKVLNSHQYGTHLLFKTIIEKTNSQDYDAVTLKLICNPNCIETFISCTRVDLTLVCVSIAQTHVWCIWILRNICKYGLNGDATTNLSYLTTIRQSCTYSS